MTSLDSYITLGRSGLRVSPLTLGTMTFGEDWGWGASPETSEAILTEYLDRGGNVVDTANVYTNGHSEKIVGDFFAARPGLRGEEVADDLLGVSVGVDVGGVDDVAAAVEILSENCLGSLGASAPAPVLAEGHR